MTSRDYGYLDNQPNGLGIVRARTVGGNLRLWEVPRSEQALDAVVSEIGGGQVPGVYMLFDERGAKKVYVGQTEDLRQRIGGHIRSPEEKIKRWDRAFIVNDGRIVSQSDFNDENVRLVIENYLVKLLRINRYSVVTTASRTPTLNSMQTSIAQSFIEEVNVLLARRSKITKLLTEEIDRERHLEEVKKTLERKGHRIEKWGRIEAVIDGTRVFVRPGSRKSAGWQVTFRGAKPDSFKSRLHAEDGYLLVPRGPILFIPLKDLKLFVVSIDSEAFSRDTIDMFFRFEEERIVVAYKGREQEVTKFAIDPFSR